MLFEFFVITLLQYNLLNYFCQTTVGLGLETRLSLYNDNEN